MFVETYTSTINEDTIKLVFIKSLNVQAFPCGRRRSTQLGEAESAPRIPFDPEARLNTEVNNRKHTGLNGFTQTYLSNWEDSSNQLIVSLAGYLFNIKLDSAYQSYEGFGNKVAKALASEINNIYINILIEETPLFSETERNLIYNTDILGSLRPSNDLTALDLPISGKERSQGSDDYYFSGLALSASPLTEACRRSYDEEKEFKTRDDFPYIVENTRKRVISLHLLEKVEDKWKIHEPARLPKIEHGETEDSVVVENLSVKDALTIEDLAKVKKLEVQEDATIKKLVTDEVQVPYTNNQDNTTITKTGVYSPFAKIAKLEALSGGISSVGDIKAPNIYQKVGEVDKKVPIIDFKEQADGTWQLQISRVNTIPKS
jgi:hypothetical protein